MNGPAHYREAARLVNVADDVQSMLAAQVHATLALVAVRADAAMGSQTLRTGGITDAPPEWAQVIEGG